MQIFSFPNWVRAHPLAAYVWLPLCIGLALAGMYFSGVEVLQNMIAPDIERVDWFSRREFGLLEMMQNFVLLAAAYYALRCLPLAKGWLMRLFVIGIVSVSLFIFLEEIDYGAHFIDLSSGSGLVVEGEWDRNLHNLTLAGGTQLSTYFKLASNVLVALLFFVAPLLLHRSSHGWVRLLVPSRWIVATVFLMILLSRLDHGLDDAGFGMIGGNEGYLSSNISEFRELNFYYLILLYVSGLYLRLRDLKE